MNCLQNYILLRGCSNEVPESGLYINSLPGITTKAIDNIANEEQVTYLAAFLEVEGRALKTFETMFRAAIAKKYKLVTPQQTVNIGDYVDTVNNQTAQSAQYRGLVFQNYNPSPFSVVHVQSIKIYSKAVEVGVAIKVYSISNDNLYFLLDTFTSDLVIGWNTILVNRSYQGQQIFIGYNSVAIESPYTGLPWDFDCGCGAYDWGWDGFNVQGATSSIVNGTQVATGQNSFGLSGIYSIRCNYDAFVCNNKSLFANALLYLLGAELMIERQYTSRLNKYTTIDIKDSQELEERFMQRYNEEFALAVDGIYIGQDECIECNASIRSMTSLP